MQSNTTLKVYTNPNILFLEDQVSKFIAGNIRNCYHKWEKITYDSKILDIMINGLSVNVEYIPHKCCPRRYPRGLEKASVINNEYKKLLLKGVIIPTSIEKQDFFSNILVRPKTDRTYQMILNLKALNFSVNVHHFKMESIHNVIHMVQHN